jgi:putative heme-binding domain-containing protein
LVEAKVEERILMGITPKQKAEYDELISTLEPVSKEKETMIADRLKAFKRSTQQSSTDSGRIIFVQNCSPCHRIGDQGGLIGPNLDGVNKWGAQALTEKIIDPNRNVAENFRTYTIKLKDGKVVTGLFRREAGEVIVFADISGQEFSVPKKNIAERTPSKYTLMPDHFGHVLTQNDFNALLNYLLNLKS